MAWNVKQFAFCEFGSGSTCDLVLLHVAYYALYGKLATKGIDAENYFASCFSPGSAALRNYGCKRKTIRRKISISDWNFRLGNQCFFFRICPAVYVLRLSGRIKDVVYGENVSKKKNYIGCRYSYCFKRDTARTFGIDSVGIPNCPFLFFRYKLLFR